MDTFKWFMFIPYVKELNALKILTMFFFKILFFPFFLHFTVNIYFIVFTLIYSFIHM